MVEGCAADSAAESDARFARSWAVSACSLQAGHDPRGRIGIGGLIGHLRGPRIRQVGRKRRVCGRPRPPPARARFVPRRRSVGPSHYRWLDRQRKETQEYCSPSLAPHAAYSTDLAMHPARAHPCALCRDYMAYRRQSGDGTCRIFRRSNYSAIRRASRHRPNSRDSSRSCGGASSDRWLLAAQMRIGGAVACDLSADWICEPASAFARWSKPPAFRIRSGSGRCRFPSGFDG